jgi:hypothetical protein
MSRLGHCTPGARRASPRAAGGHRRGAPCSATERETYRWALGSCRRHGEGKFNTTHRPRLPILSVNKP